MAEIRLLDEMTRRLTFFNSLLEAENISARPLQHSTSAHLLNPSSDSHYASLLDSLNLELKDQEIRLNTMNASYDTLRKRLGELEEAQHVLRETAIFFERAQHRTPDEDRQMRGSMDDDRAGLLDNAAEAGRADLPDEAGLLGGPSFELEFVAGTIDRARMPTFERVLWRVLRGNMYLNWVCPHIFGFLSTSPAIILISSPMSRRKSMSHSHQPWLLCPPRHHRPNKKKLKRCAKSYL